MDTSNAMDFALGDDHKAIRDLVAQVLADTCAKERLDALERDGGFLSAPAWSALAESGLIGLMVPESHGGAGMGTIEMCLALIEVGAHVAPVPLLDCATLAAPALAAADPEVRDRWLPGVLDGSVIASCALGDPGSRHPIRPSTRGSRTGDGWVLSGARSFVPWPEEAGFFVIPAASDDGPGLWLVAADAAGIERATQVATDGAPMAELRLTDTPATRIGGKSELVGLVDRAVLGRSAIALGVSRMALSLTAEHCRTREQFGMPIGSFQAVTQRAGDMYIDVQTQELSLWHAAFLAENPSASGDDGRALAIARYHANEAGHRVVAAAQHLHGGMGFDRDYPLHRCFLWARRLELGMGNAREALARLGDLIAA